MGDDVTEWSNPVHVERRCPLCRATRTRFVDVYSDGDEVVECSFGRQKCKGCGLSCKHWDAIDALTAENAELREKVADYVDTVSAMVTAATGTEDIDEQERLLNAAGPKPSCFIAELRKRVEVAEHQGTPPIRVLWCSQRRGPVVIDAELARRQQDVKDERS